MKIPKKIDYLGKTYIRVYKPKAREAYLQGKSVLLKGYTKRSFTTTCIMNILNNLNNWSFDKTVEEFIKITGHKYNMCNYFMEA